MERRSDDEDIADESDDAEEMSLPDDLNTNASMNSRKTQLLRNSTMTSLKDSRQPNLMETTVTRHNEEDEEEDTDVNAEQDSDMDEEMTQEDDDTWGDVNDDIKLDDDGWGDDDDDLFEDDDNLEPKKNRNTTTKQKQQPSKTSSSFEVEDTVIADADDMIPISSPNLSRHQSYMVLDHNAFLQQKKRVVAMTAEVLFVSKDEAECLLRAYGWKSRKLQTDWFDNEKKVRDTVGLTPINPDLKYVNGIPLEKYTSSPNPDLSNILVQCEAYCDETPITNAHALACGHIFCNDCWQGALESEIRTGPACISTKCMGMRCTENHPHKFGCRCREIVPESLFYERVQDPELLKNYQRYAIDSFVEGQKNIRWCPRPGCTYAVSYTSGGTKSVKCTCGHYFCFSCGEDAHAPAPCDLVRKWLIREKNDDATAIWLAAKTKECPKCNVRIEKNKACNHMTCTKCGHGFCWLCKGTWASHGSSTGGYYVCNKYEADSKEGKYTGEEKAIIDNQKILQKYTYYYKRFKASGDAIKLTGTLGDRIEQLMSQKEADLTRYGYLMEAIEKLIAARRVLQWTYALAYYFKDGGTKHLFEYQQDMLMGTTEALQDIMESNVGDLEILSSLRKDIINKISSMDKFRQEMVAQVERGDFEDILLSEADGSMESWGCVNCRAENAPTKDFCHTCNACRTHGEADCRGCKGKDSKR